MTNKTILIITDGIGHNNSSNFNALKNANTPTYDYLFKNVPYSLIHTYGTHVGLPDGQMGNSEVGHMSIGSGRVLYQDLVKVNLAIQNDTLKDNELLNSTIEKSNNIHLIGLISDGGVHSHINHVIAFAKISKNLEKKVFIHIITDGRDVAPNCAKKYIKEIENICDDDISIATICGRYYAMDRDNRWDRIKKAYDAIALGLPKTNENVNKYIDDSYKNDILDEFIVPASLNDYNGFEENDGIIFCNFRSDRMREMSNAIANKNFSEFPRVEKNLNIATITEYDKNFPLPILFPKDTPKNTLAEVISNNGLKQLHTAETEKYAHVTFFFNGGLEEPYLNETRVLIPSPDVATYDLKPQMSAPEVGVEVRRAMDEEYDFVVVNFANGDMVGHTGIYEAGIKAVEAVDFELGKIIEKAKEKNYNIVLTSDHGNCEMMRNEEGETLTNHTVGDVYCFVMSSKVKEVKTGSLNNIAPTVLKLMNLDIPKEMDEALI
ncbi:phosphoglycerate mutase, 2,3-bisphosphoglycerate-independent [Arcobacter nitrofigilis DSM 7299]|uniref:2,3-bisphosphoglycerate-independent phosphoglycerate mutase n=1 Tax=Arcobacter nitrofigilis (strain ATCC 33309 / DSM 7299 / CCUG 15893 / LMG 7604 / NCTC 12251 / CI) TaxID=572480 RepID=D5V6K6_ARCNC|nr:2,3-bisphosphoglycerate-independent phosphoglycerate mutase [Arcobacter nitrofigilis]ADG94276.1 phosphoglycerate mutase, 2,3-bisphosphoglycerate-independent [Arcobacter nitrofigilis DSM 7299]